MDAQLGYAKPQENEAVKKDIGMSRLAIYETKSPIERLQILPKNSIDEGEQLKGICVKFSYVLIPRNQQNTSTNRNWDLWGPFLMCLVYALFTDSPSTFMALIFAVFVGAIVVTFNIKVLGGKISYFNSVSILGYCICPIFLALILFHFLNFLQVNNTIIRFVVTSLAAIWAIFAARSFLGVSLPEERRLVGLYPIIIFYFFIAILLIFK